MGIYHHSCLLQQFYIALSNHSQDFLEMLLRNRDKHRLHNQSYQMHDRAFKISVDWKIFHSLSVET